MQTIETLSVKLVGDVTDFTSKMQGAMGAIQAVGDKMQAVGDRMQAIGQKWSIFVTAPIVAFGKSALDSAADFEVSMNVIEKVTGATTEQMKEMSDQALKLGKDTVFSAGEAAQAQIELAKAGMDVYQTMAAMPGVLDLAAAGDVELAKAAKLTAGVLNAFSMEASESAYVANLLAAAANSSAADMGDLALGMAQGGFAFAAAGQGADDLAASLAILTNVGLKGTDAGTALKNMFQQLYGPTKTAREVMAKFGLDVFDAAGNMLPLAEIIDVFNSKLGDMSQEQRLAILDVVLLSDGMKAMIPLMTAGKDGFIAMKDAVNEQGQASEVADARMKGLAGAIEYFRGTLESMMIDTALPWLNTLSAIIRATADWIAKFGELDPALQRNIVIFAALAAALGPVLIYSGLIISSLGSIISLFAALNPWLVAASVAMAAVGGAFYLGADNLQILWKYLKGAAVDWRYMSDLIGWLPTPIQGVVQFLGKLIVTFEVLGKYIWGVITDGRVMSDLIGWLPTPIQDAVQAFGVFIGRVREWVLNWRENLGEWLVILQGWAQAAWQWIADAMPPVREKLLAWWELMRGWLMDRLPEWMATLQGWAQAAWQWIADMTPVALAKLSEWTNALLAWVIGKLPDWLAVLLRWATAAVTWIGDTIPDVIRGFGEWVRSIVGWGDGEGRSKLNEMIDRWIRILSEWVVNDLIPKIGPEIKKFGGALYNALVDMIASVRDAAWNIGVGIVQGMISGIQSMWNRLIDSARQLAGLAVTTAQDELEQHSPSRKGLAIGANFAESIGMGAREAMGQLSLDVTAGLRGALSDTDLHYATVGAGGRGGGMPAIVLNQNFYGNVDRAAVASGGRDGILQGLRQVGLS